MWTRSVACDLFQDDSDQDNSPSTHNAHRAKEEKQRSAIQEVLVVLFITRLLPLREISRPPIASIIIVVKGLLSCFVRAFSFYVYENSEYFASAVCLEIKKSFVLDSARTCLKIWNRVDRGPFTIQGQKGNEIGRVVPKLSTISW